MKWIQKHVIENRMLLLGVVFFCGFSVLLSRFYRLQVISGAEYQEQFSRQITREQRTPGSRGIIYDRNGEILAYNELVYAVTMEDSGSYETRAERNQVLNETISQVLRILESHGDSIMDTFSITYQETEGYQYKIQGTRLARFLADVYGHADISDLTYNERLGYEEGAASAEQVMEYLCSEQVYGIGDGYSREEARNIAAVRYALGENSYQRYVPVTLAEAVSEEARVEILENQPGLPGVDIVMDTVRRYNDSLYFAHILGYTGPVSEEELAEFESQGLTYGRNDQVGKAGLERTLEQELRGTDGQERFLIDHVGRVTEVLERREAAAGNDVYLTIDARLQRAVYQLLEQKLAGILLSNLVPEKDEASGELTISAEDVAIALIENHVIQINEFASGEEIERELWERLQDKEQEHLQRFREEMGKPYETMEAEFQAAADYVLELSDKEGYLTGTPSEEVQESWRQGVISLEEYLQDGLKNGWLTGMETESRYVTLEDELDTLRSWIFEKLPEDIRFWQVLYVTMLKQGEITKEQLCMVLYEQGVLENYDGLYEALRRGEVNAYGFFREKIRNLEITPADLALDPCTASSVIVDPENGQVLACVTYPGYDGNRLANSVDGTYYSQLLQDASLPLYNNATQQRTAPGSTFKPVTAAAALTEGMIDKDTVIEDHGIFEEIVPSPRCWIYPMGATHGAITVTEALRDSCNYFFYQLGYQMSMSQEIYEPEQGIAVLQKYMELFGLNEASGIEIAENAPQNADEYPVTAAIGQSNHNYTTAQLARYASVLANHGSLYKLTLVDRIQNEAAGAAEERSPIVTQSLEEISQDTWETIGEGMNLMAEENRTLSQLDLPVAGKTGTAQQSRNRPNHALFIGYAPYENPQLAVATRIAYGYSSSNAVEVTADIFRYYFGLEPKESLITGQAALPTSQGNVFAD